MSYDTNPYYNPENFNPPLKMVACLSLNDEAYQFQLRCIWRAKDGTLYTAYDSGCSCPTPFEDITSLSDMNKLNITGRGQNVSFARLREEAMKTQPSAQDDFYSGWGEPPSMDTVKDYIKILNRLERRARSSTKRNKARRT